MSLSRQQLEDLQDAFQVADMDGDGRISASEFERLMDDMGIDARRPELQVRFREIDRDHDGLIDLDEFVRWWQLH